MGTWGETVCSFKENFLVMTSSLQSLSFDGDIAQSTVPLVSLTTSVSSNERPVFRSRDPYHPIRGQSSQKSQSDDDDDDLQAPDCSLLSPSSQ